MKDTRPMFLNLMQIKFPPTALASILHRVSGVLIFLFIPFMLWMLAQSLASSTTFEQLSNILALPAGKILIWIMLLALFYHILAGIRHLLFDFVLDESYRAGCYTAYGVFLLFILAAIATGIWIWGV